MTTEARPTPPLPPPADEPPQPPAKPKLKSSEPRIVVIMGILVIIIAAYALSLFGVHLLEKSDGPLPALDLSHGGGKATIVELRLEELKPVANRLTVNVRVYPGIAAYDDRFNVLDTDVTVQLNPTGDLGDLHYPKGKHPAQLTTTIEAHGDPGNWPFDWYRTEPITADAFIGSGDNPKKVSSHVEVTGQLDGWDVSLNRVRDPAVPPNSRAADNGNVVITLRRAKGPLIFDLGICLILVSLPTLALLVAIPMALGRRKFVPPFATWYAANLFAIIPLRNILPGSPPPGSWIDQAIIQWVLIALVTATTLYLFAWFRQGD
jgi:hypothetical protein